MMNITRRTISAGLLLSLASPIFAAAKVVEKDVSIATPDGTADVVIAYPAGKGHWPAVILWHDQVGLRPVWREMARKLAGEGYVVLAPNGYYRSGKASGADLDMRDAKVREQVAAMRAAAIDDGVARDAVAYVGWLDKQAPVAKRRKMGTIGYDLGGSFAFRTAAAVPERIAAVASIHGLGAATARPNSPHLLVPKTKAAYFVVQSKDDDAREPEDKNDYAKVIAEGKLKGTVEVYPANHGFGVPGNVNHDATSAEKAWTEILKLLKRALG